MVKGILSLVRFLLYFTRPCARVLLVSTSRSASPYRHPAFGEWAESQSFCRPKSWGSTVLRISKKFITETGAPRRDRPLGQRSGGTTRPVSFVVACAMSENIPYRDTADAPPSKATTTTDAGSAGGNRGLGLGSGSTKQKQHKPPVPRPAGRMSFHLGKRPGCGGC